MSGSHSHSSNASSTCSSSFTHINSLAWIGLKIYHFVTISLDFTYAWRIDQNKLSMNLPKTQNHRTDIQPWNFFVNPLNEYIRKGNSAYKLKYPSQNVPQNRSSSPSCPTEESIKRYPWCGNHLVWWLHRQETDSPQLLLTLCLCYPNLSIYIVSPSLEAFMV